MPVSYTHLDVYKRQNEVLETLFRDNFVLVTADAAQTLCDRGLGRLAGLERVRWMRQNQGEYAFEQVTANREYAGRQQARASAILSCSDACLLYTSRCV